MKLNIAIIRLEAIALGLEAIASRLDRLEAVSEWVPSDLSIRNQSGSGS